MNESLWHLLCHTSEVEKDLSYLVVKYLDQEVVCYKQNGNIHVFKNFCPHRGSKLVTNTSGTWNGKCPYHGLEFSEETPVNGLSIGFNERSLNRLKLQQVKQTRCGNFIFFNFSDKAAPLEEQLGKVLFSHIEDISHKIETTLDLNEYQYDCRWEVAVENALEPLHLPEIHAESLNLLDLDGGKIVTDVGGLFFDHQIQNKRYRKSLEILKPKLSDSSFPSTYHSAYLYPFTFISSTYGLSFSIQTFFPTTSDFQTNFSSKLFAPKLQKEEYNNLFSSFFDSTIKTNRQVFEEDYIATKNTVNLKKHWLGPLAKSEEKIKWFRKKLGES